MTDEQRKGKSTEPQRHEQAVAMVDPGDAIYLCQRIATASADGEPIAEVLHIIGGGLIVEVIATGNRYLVKIADAVAAALEIDAKQTEPGNKSLEIDAKQTEPGNKST